MQIIPNVETGDSIFCQMSFKHPQGLVNGPALFLLYTKGIPDELNETCRLFAVDTISYLTVKSNAAAEQLQNESNGGVWVGFHPDKCKVLLKGHGPQGTPDRQHWHQLIMMRDPK